MKIVAIICRVLLGLMFVVFGANGLHPFMHMAMPPAGSLPYEFMDVMALKSNWMHIVAALQLIGGLLILFGGTVPLGICILCPITFNILLFHLLLTGGQSIAPGAFSAMLELVLIYAYRANFGTILTYRAEPVPSVAR